MTEAEWLRCSQPKRMLSYVGEKASLRKSRLFSYASCCHVLEKLSDDSRRAVEKVEEAADELISKNELLQARDVAEKACIAGDTPTACALRAAYAAVGDSPFAVNHELMKTNRVGDRRRQASIIQEIFGNPFRPITLSPSWLTSTVVSLANQMYDTRDFSAMPILADALMDASCDNETILTHCRGSGPHVRGCFVIDLLTGRE